MYRLTETSHAIKYMQYVRERLSENIRTSAQYYDCLESVEECITPESLLQAWIDSFNAGETEAEMFDVREKDVKEAKRLFLNIATTEIEDYVAGKRLAEQED
ncbi:hypothetical protein F1C16_05055 [Hymenobacter sp. NBH84]|uniref:hypothetical protein n=1 Tax=Hymenobacter sp. NBH84 TaxID=2596915 RepID=UPI0016269B31|nr:hypothetical protein [Hymenobacter sp. NBH84]QNE38964.1 hypothetical protein F1C16_05055 [Hymenobacter sp. NBH84]